MTGIFEKNNPSISNNEIEQLVQSKQAKELLNLLQSDGGALLQKATQAAAVGDYEKVQKLLSPMLQSKEAQRILRQQVQENG